MGFLQGVYTAAGTGGAFVTVLPVQRMVVVHRVDIDRKDQANVSPSSYVGILTVLADLYCGEKCS